jgi:two-component system sensor histidine kinase UhpB
MPLLWRVFLTNAAILALATAALAAGPFTMSLPIGSTELLVLLVGPVVMLVFQPAAPASRLRFAPRAGRDHAAAGPARRRPPRASGGEPDVAALAVAFDEMLYRRNASAATASGAH